MLACSREAMGVTELRVMAAAVGSGAFETVEPRHPEIEIEGRRLRLDPL